MRQLKSIGIVALLFLAAELSNAQEKGPAHSTLNAVFVASTPCSLGTKPLPGIPNNADCELIKWNLTLYSNGSATTPSSYKLNCAYGMAKQGTTGFIGGGTKIEMEGKLTIVNTHATANHRAVYQLFDNKTNKTISLLSLNSNLLHLLDSDNHLMIGSAAWSYTLNRIN